nr:PQQ-binding-like beta-propeller repeat protein [Natrarchaeobius halalkaliphilus]
MPTDTHDARRYSLGEIESARSRHMWTRSTVHATADRIAVGEWDGTVTTLDPNSLEPRWSVDHPDHAVGIETLEPTGTVVVAGRGETGSIVAYDAETGEKRWQYDTVEDVGRAIDDTIFSQPYVVAIETDDGGDDVGCYAAARRYERDGETRQWHSTVFAFDSDGTVRWRYETDGSSISIDLDDTGERLAVGYNRCPGGHDHGLVVLETATGDPEWAWDPGTPGDRRVGDVSFDGDSIAAASHGDKRGYLLGPGGTEQWRVDLAVETELDGETLYAYPNHVYASDGRVAFVTGNTYATESRETENRHPNEHRLMTFDAGGDRLWDAEIRGFAHGIDADDGTIVAPCAQNFRVRDPETHAVRWFDLGTGVGGIQRLEGIATAAAIDGRTIATIEEPVEYHDETCVRGDYALQLTPLTDLPEPTPTR